MKTLDGVISDLEQVIYFTDADSEDEGYYLARDCLYYLNKYRELRAIMDWHEEMEVIRNSIINRPLTWDELTQMKHKPVWVENKMGLAEWGIVDDVKEDYITICSGFNNCGADIPKQNYPEIWQVYRYERK